jgi:protein O-GlcNAc transferase
MNLKDVMNQACDHLRADRLDQAEDLFRQVLAERPTLPDALHLLGCTVAKRGRPEEAVELIRRAVVLEPTQPVFQSNLGLTLLSAGRKREAIAAFSQSLSLQPNQPNTLNLLGNTLSDVGEFDRAIHCFNQAVQLRPTEPGYFYNLGNCWYRKATRMIPGANVPGYRVEDLNNAVESFQNALGLAPRYTDAGNNLGNTLRALGRMDEAIAAWRRTVAAGQHFFAHYNLGRALYEKDLIDDALDSMRAGLRINPNFPDAYNNMGNLYRQSGRVDQAISQFDKALELDPANALAHSNKLYTLYYDSRLNAKDILKQHQQWNERIARPLSHSIKPHGNDRSPGRRLRIGYVSPNFWGHCQSLFTIPLLSNHYRENFYIYCYSDVAAPDATTVRLRSFASVWRNIVGMNDDQVAELIRKDQIDILVDLTLHMAENRILLFARKSAPVQVTWLGYPGTTGLETIDYRLTDPYLDPPETSDEFYAEKSIRLPHTFWCLDRAALESPHIPHVNPLPASENGYVTFGCLNNFCKVNQPLLELWKRVLDAVPNSRMVLLAPPGSSQKWVRQTLGERVDFAQRADRPAYLKYHHRIDISLDTLPYNGHTTTLDSLWMGVPVITMIGETVVGRAGLSQLTNLGLSDLVTNNPDQFVRCAASLANDLPRLTDLRRALRYKMRTSPLMDGARFAGDIEFAYRTMWESYCKQIPHPGPRLT